MTVHNHPPYEPPCNERTVDGQLRGACLNDDGTPVTYLDPATELDRLRHENANLNGLLTLRSAALNRTGTQNDHLRATVAACAHCRNSLEPTT